MASWTETDLPYGGPISQIPSSLLTADLDISKNNPAIMWDGTEANSLHKEFREISGDWYQVSNATYASGAWQLSNNALVAYGLRLLANGKLQRIYAVSGTNPGILTWVVLTEFSELGHIVSSPLTDTAPLPALSLTPTWNFGASVGSGILFNVTDTASNASSRLIDLQVNGTTKFAVDKSGNFVGGVGSSATANGYAQLFGIILQWGTATGVVDDGSAEATVTFPVPFPTACFSFIPVIDDSAAFSGNATGIHVDSITRTSARVTVFGGPSVTNVSVRWMAVGN